MYARSDGRIEARCLFHYTYILKGRKIDMVQFTSQAPRLPVRTNTIDLTDFRGSPNSKIATKFHSTVYPMACLAGTGVENVYILLIKSLSTLI